MSDLARKVAEEIVPNRNLKAVAHVVSIIEPALAQARKQALEEVREVIQKTRDDFVPDEDSDEDACDIAQRSGHRNGLMFCINYLGVLIKGGE